MEATIEQCTDIRKFLELWEALKDRPIKSFERIGRETIVEFNGRTLWETYEADKGFNGTGFITPPYEQDGGECCAWITPEPSRQVFYIGESQITFDWDGNSLKWQLHINPDGRLIRTYRLVFA